MDVPRPAEGASRRIERSELLDMLDSRREATFTDELGYHELFVVPDPDTARYLVLVRTEDASLHHVTTFDTGRLTRTGRGNR